MSENRTVAARAIIAAWLEEARVEGSSDVYESKREAHRFTWDRPLEMLVAEQIQYVYARDISDKGIGLLCKHRLRAGDIVHVRSSEVEPWVRCRVAHVTQTVGAYKVGVDVQFEIDD